MTHHDYQYSRQIQYRWHKEQQLIRRKYQIPYNIIYTSKSCHDKSSPISSHPESLFKHDQINLTDKSIKRKTDVLIPPMFCSKCHLNLTECLCKDGLGQWWIHLQKRSHQILKKKSRSSSIRERHVSFIDLSSIEQINPPKPQYVLLDWHNRQSLLKFLQTTELPTKNLSNMSLEQLQQLITDQDHIRIFNSIIDLILTMYKEQHRITFCNLYIDSNLLIQSHLIADNINLKQVLYSIENISILLGVKIDPHRNSFSFSRLSTKQRKSILNQHSLFLTSKIPSNTFRHTSAYTQ